MSIKEHIENVQSGKIRLVDTVKKWLNEAKKINKEYHYFTAISDDLAISLAKAVENNPKGKLAGLPVSVKDCICVKGVESAAGSRILGSYKPPYNATVVDRLIHEGAIIIGKTSQDAFGFGSFSLNTEDPPKNPFDKSRVTGGSSGGAAGITQKASFPHVAIAESTGGSISNPAAFCGVVGLTPTYGIISRYGLIDYGSSLDKIGIMAKDTESARIVFDVIKGHDPHDSTSVIPNVKADNQIRKVAVIKESLDINKGIKALVLDKLKGMNLKYDIVSMPLTFKYGLAAYYIIALSEASTNLAKYCGLRYGMHLPLKDYYNRYFSSVRGKFFSKEAKRRVILGTFTRMAGYRDAYYLKALKVRTLMINEYKQLFNKYSLLISPSMPITAPKQNEVSKLEPIDVYRMDILTVGPNLAGLPHISIPCGYIDKLPVGVMFIADHFMEDKLLRL